MLLNRKEQVHFWRELERVEQWLSTGAGAAVGRVYDSMGQPGTQAFTNYGNHFAAGIARVERVRQALDQSAPMAQRLMVQQLSGIGLSTVWDILIAACKEIALYYGGAVVTGAVVGGVIGSVAFGVGAAPGAVIGTAAGAQVGMWGLALLGLKELAEGLDNMLPVALEHYERGFREAWGAAPGDRRDGWNGTTGASGNTYTGAWHMAQGHAIMVMAILTALTAYLTRGRGNKALLMQARPSTPAGVGMAEPLPTQGRGTSAPKSGARAGAGGANSATPALRQVGMSRLALPRTEGLSATSTTAELLKPGAIPGREGVILQQRTVPFADIWQMSEKSGVEFVLTQENGSWMLRSGSSTSAPIPGGVRPTLHTHPFDADGLNSVLPSKADINILNNYWARNPTMPRPVSQILTGQPEPTRFYATGLDPWH